MKRYDFKFDCLGDCNCDMEEDPHGSYVNYSDLLFNVVLSEEVQDLRKVIEGRDALLKRAEYIRGQQMQLIKKLMKANITHIEEKEA